MTWGEIGRAIWTKVWPAVAALAVLAAWGLGSWLLSVAAGGVFLPSAEQKTTHGVPLAIVATVILLVGIAVGRWLVSVPPSAPVPARERDSAEWMDWRDVFDVPAGEPTVELVGGPFDGRQALPPRPARLLWVAVGENGVPDAFAARQRPEIREGARLLGHYEPGQHDAALTWVASD